MPLEPAQVLLSKALDDERLALLVVNDSTISDEQVGFLAQQAIEKAMKSVLSFHRIQYRRTHDLSELLDLLEKHRIEFSLAYGRVRGSHSICRTNAIRLSAAGRGRDEI